MACKYCSIHIEKFNTQAVFQTFTAKLDRLIDAGKMVEVATDIAHGAFIINEYQCVECKQFWTLSIPDQAFRGGWCEKEV